MPRTKIRIPRAILERYIVTSEQLSSRWRPTGIFPEEKPLIVDVGCGNGDFLYPYARRHAEVNVLGIEIQWKRVWKSAGKLHRHNITNARLICDDFRQVLSRHMPPAAVKTFWFNFPDPWPKKKHHKWRLIDGVSARLLERSLEPGGAVMFVTDVRELAEEASLYLNGCSRLVNAHAPASYVHDMPGYVQSYYYKKWKSEGCRFFFLRYEKQMVD